MKMNLFVVFLFSVFFMSQSSETLNNKDKHFSAIFLIICSVYSVQDTYRYLFFALKMNLKPGFVIFNPGTENSELEEMLTLEGVKTEEACSLVLLSIGEL